MKKLLQIILFMLLVALVCTVNAQGFITTWKTDNPGTSGTNQITIPTNGSYTYDYNIYWEDVNDPLVNGSATNITGDHTITFPAAGTYSVEITGTFPAIKFYPAIQDDAEKLLSIMQWGSISWQNMESAFDKCSNMTYYAIDSPDLSMVTDMSRMFAECSQFNGAIGSWDVSGVSDMSSMFKNAISFNSDISAWVTTSLVNSGEMFYGASAFNQSIGGWNTDNLLYASSMFRDATSFNQDIGGWNMSNVSQIQAMFLGAAAFNQDLGNWTISSATDLSNMFNGALVFDQNLGLWDVSHVTSMSSMLNNSGMSQINYDATLLSWSQMNLVNNVFFGASTSNYGLEGAIARQILIDDFGWNILDDGVVVPIFNESDYFITTWFVPAGQELTISTLSTSKDYSCVIDWGDGSEIEHYVGSSPSITHTYATTDNYSIKIAGYFPRFYNGLGTSKDLLHSIDQWGTIVWEDLSYAFSSNKNLTSYNATDVPDLANVTSLEGTFSWTDASNISISSWDVSNITDMSLMFNNCTLATDIYGEILQQWSQQPLQNNVNFHVGNSTYSIFASSARQKIIDDFGWTITDGGLAPIAEEDYFITTWDIPAGHNLVIPTGSGANITDYNCAIDWGDGSELEIFTGNDPDPSHVYTDAGTYTIKIAGTFPWLNINNSVDAAKLMTIEQWGSIEWESMEGAFRGCSNMLCNAPDAPDLSMVSSLSQMFEGAENFNGAIGNWNVSTITDMSAMFSGASLFNQSLNDWQVNNVLNMSGMFEEATSFNENISSWTVTNVADMSGLFSYATSFNQDLSGWDVSGVTDMSYLFANATAFNQNLSAWNVTTVTDMSGMFSEASSFDQDISTWNVSNVEFMDEMFFSENSDAGLNQENYDRLLTEWSKLSLQNGVTFSAGGSKYSINLLSTRLKIMNDFGWTIYDTGIAEILEEDYFITTWDIPAGHNLVIPTGGGVDISDYGCAINWGDGSELEIFTGDDPDPSHLYADAGTYTIKIAGTVPWLNINNSVDAPKLMTIEQWGSIEWESMESAFANCINMTHIATDTPDLSSVISLRRMFYNADNFNGEIGNWDVSNITDMSFMFAQAFYFNSDISEWDVSGVTNMSNMFTLTAFFNQNLSGWDVSKVTDMSSMFEQSGSFNQDISSWNVSNVELMNDMFFSENFDIGLTQENYNRLLTEWSKLSLQSGVNFHAGNSTYTILASDARQTLVNDLGWTITDGGQVFYDPVIETTNSTSYDENATGVVLDVNVLDGYGGSADENITYSFSGLNADENAFDLDASTGELSFIEAPDYETPLDEDADNVYEISVVATNQTDNTATLAISITVIDLNDNTPQITSDATASITENSTEVMTVVATDADAGSSLTYSISDGVDQALFVIDSNTGELTFASAPDFENPLDENSNNDYQVQIEVSDGENDAVQNITVSVNNINEGPVVVKSISDQNLPEGFSWKSVDLSPVFADVDGDALSYEVTENTATNIITTSISGSGLTLLEQGVGTAVITVTASDGKGGSVSDEFVVNVIEDPNYAPVVANSIPDMNLDEGFSPKNIDLISVFNDPDGDDLSYSISNDNTSAVSATLDTNLLVIEGAGTGTATITVTANDGNGGSVSDEFIVTVNAAGNNQPTVVSEISDINVEEGFTPQAIDLTPVFTDADGDALSYSVNNDNTGVVSATIDGSTLTISEVGLGSATITVTASDGKGGSVSDEFIVTVNAAGNNQPTVVSEISDINIEEGFTPQAIDLTPVFTDADGDALSYSVNNDNTGVVSATIDGSTLTISEVGLGSATITVTASDGKGGSVSDGFVVTVNAAGNNQPTVVSEISDINVEEGFTPQAIDLTPVFTDADGDALSYSVNNDNTGVVSATIDGSTLTISEVGLGSAIITVTASDGKGGDTFDQFAVTVSEVLGLEEEDLVLVYPNPVSGMVTIELPENAKKIDLYNTLGQKVRVAELVPDSKRVEISLEELGSGTYLMIIETSTSLFRKTVIKRDN